MVRKLSTYVKPGGYLYIETPQEVSDQRRMELQTGAWRFDLGIHEHINYYCVPAVKALLEAAGFNVVAIESAPVDVGLGEIRAYSRTRTQTIGLLTNSHVCNSHLRLLGCPNALIGRSS